jgi:hypothetical protein
MRESRTYGSVRAKAKWLSYSTIAFKDGHWSYEYTSEKWVS